LIKPDNKGRVTDKALIVTLTGTPNIFYRLEHSTYYVQTYGSQEYQEHEVVRMTPDITIKIKPEKGWKAAVKDAMKEMVAGEKLIAVELENDIHWDFQESLKQIKKYKKKFRDTRIIIPNDFKKFAPLYKHEGFRVYLWRAKRVWQCLKCNTETDKEGPVFPKCSGCGNVNQNDFRLVGLKEPTINEFS
jgi:rubrerythrin